MPRSRLHQQKTRIGVLAAVRRGATVGEAAGAVGLSARAVQRFAKEHPAFAREFDAAKVEGDRVRAMRRGAAELGAGEMGKGAGANLPREDSAQLGDTPLIERAGRVSSALGVDPTHALEAELPPDFGPTWVLALACRVAMDRESRAQGKALEILERAVLAPLERSREGSAVGNDTRPRVLLMAPDNGSYAPGCGSSDSWS